MGAWQGMKKREVQHVRIQTIISGVNTKLSFFCSVKRFVTSSEILHNWFVILNKKGSAIVAHTQLRVHTQNCTGTETNKTERES